MQEKGWEFKSRDVDEIYKYVKGTNKVKRDSNSKAVLNQVLGFIDHIIHSNK